MRLLTLIAVMSGLVLAVPAAAEQPGKKKESNTSVGKPPADPGKAAAPTTPPLNACGCYEDSTGVCRCAKQNKCGCPGECEPNGCEDKRRKELAKEEQEEIKRQRDEDKKRNAELAKKRDDDERKEAQKRERNLRGLRLVEPK